MITHTKSKQELVVEQMIAIRDKRAELKAAYDEADAELKEQWARGEAWLLNELNTSGAKGLKFACGSVTKTQTTAASVGDWRAFASFILNTGEIDLLQPRVSSGNLKQYMSREGGQLPPGVDIETINKLSIRRASNKGE